MAAKQNPFCQLSTSAQARRAAINWRHLVSSRTLIRYLGAALVANISAAFAQDAVLTGELDYRAFSSSSQVLYETKSRFSVRVSLPLSTNWTITVAPGNGALSNVLSYSLGNDDGIVYRLQRSKAEVVNALLSRNPALTNQVPCLGKGAIVPGDIPPSEPEFFAGPIWLAYASSHFLLTNRQEMLPPPWPTPLDAFASRTYLLKTAIISRSGATSLPIRAVFLSEGGYPVGPMSPGAIGKASLASYSSPYDKGFTNGIFSTGSLTNVGSSSFPLTFVLQQFRPKPTGQSSGEIVLAAEWRGKLTSLSTAPPLADYRPRLADPVNKFDDYRFSGSATANLHYFNSNQTWAASSNDLRRLGRILGKLDAASAKKVTKAPAPAKARALVLGCLGLCSIGLVLLLCRKQRHATNETI